MCLSQVGRVVKIDAAAARAVIDVEGTRRAVSLAVLTLEGRTVDTGDWLVAHTGFAVEVLDPDEGRRIAALHREIRAAPAPTSTGREHEEEVP